MALNRIDRPNKSKWYPITNQSFNGSTFWAVILIALAIKPLAAIGQATEDSLPDVVFIISDDQAWNDYSFMGHTHIETPNIDRLAHESLLFTRGYVPDSLCRPSLATMITGLYPHQHGIVGNDPPPRILEQTIDTVGAARGRLYRDNDYQKQVELFLVQHIDQLTTLPERLKSLGYTSLQTGKWWEGNFSRGGFDQGMTHGELNRGGRHGDEGLTIGRKTMQPISDFIASAKSHDQPYFLWYAPFLPHAPHDPPAELLDKYLKVAPTESIAKYWAMCEWFDQTVGNLRNIIKEKGRSDNTLIIYVCDNGWINLPNRSAYAPRSKRSQYDGGIRTPIMVHWPGNITPRRDEQQLASSIDLVPTVMSLVGLPADPLLPGINLTSPSAVSARTAIYGEILEHDIQEMDHPASSLMHRWIIDGKWKMIVPHKKIATESGIELFDILNDPWEEHNVAKEQAEIVNRLQKQLDNWWNPE